MLLIWLSTFALLIVQSVHSSPVNNEVYQLSKNLSSSLIYQDRQYIVGFTKVNWIQANFICNANGYTLASVNSIKQNSTLNNFIAKNVAGDESATEIPQDLVFWLGGTDLADTGNWIWLSNGLPVYIKNWDTDEPSQTSACLFLNSNFKWKSGKCDELNGFICESVCPLDGGFSVEIYV